VNAISENYQSMFDYVGRHEDKHKRKHSVYEVLEDTSALKLIELGAPEVLPEETSHMSLTQEHIDSVKYTLPPT